MKTLKELRDAEAKLKARAEQKLAEITDDTAPDAARSIRDEHEKILAELAETRTAIREREAAEVEAAVRGGEGQTQPAAAPGDAAAMERTINERVDARIAADRQRTADLTLIARRGRFTDEELRTAIDDGTTVAAFRQRAFDRLADEADATSMRGVSGRAEFPRGGLDDTQTHRDAMANAILHRHDPVAFALTDAGREFRGIRLFDFARVEVERAHGRRSLFGQSETEIVRRAFHTTSDFPEILGNVTRLVLRGGYDNVARTFTAWARRSTVPDFREMKRVRLGEGPALEKVNEHGEFKSGSLTEGKESIRIETFGRIVGITRQVIINDQLGAFADLASLLGEQAANLESDVVYAILNSNAIMGDGVALFHANHGNLVGSGAALSVASLGASRLLLRKARGQDGTTRLNIRAQYLLVPTALETLAEQLLATVNNPDSPANAVPASMRSLQVIAEPRLDDGSATAFYLAADPNVIDTIEYAYLEGNEGAYTETRMGFDIDGMEVKCRLDFGAAAIDYRGLAKNPGA